MTNIKKVVAGASAIAILTMNMINFTANAANVAINGATATNVTTALTITKAGVFTDTNEITFASLKRLDGSAATTTVAGYAATAWLNDVSEITLNADPTVWDNNQILVISFVTATGDFWSAQLVVGTPTSNTVTVTANVVPTLSLALTNTTVSLGSLSTAGAVSSSSDPTATVATNAADWFTLQVASTNNGLASATALASWLTAAESLIEAGAVGAGTEGYALAVTETTDTQGNGSVVASPSLAGAAVNMATSTGPNVGYVATVDVQASISAITPAAADYTDTLTFTVTGSF